jgi:hypothetical protein
MAERTDGGRQIRLALGPAGWALGGGEYDDDGLCEYVVTDDGTGEQRRWKVRVPLSVNGEGELVAGDAAVEEIVGDAA